MKLRIQGNSLRLRLNQAEVAQFSKTGFVEDVTNFPGAPLTYSLESFSKLEGFRASFRDGALRVEVPGLCAKEWAATDLVGMGGEQSLNDGKTLSILIEKDFQCLHSGSPDPQAYPNPLVDSGRPIE